MTFWDVIEDNGEDDEPQYVDDEDEPEEEIRPPARRRQRTAVFDDEEDENDEDNEPFNTPELSAEHALFITQPDPEEYHEPGTLSRTQKGKAPAARKRSSSMSNVWARFGFSADTTTSAPSSPPAPKRDSKPGDTSTSISVPRVAAIGEATHLSSMWYCSRH